MTTERKEGEGERGAVGSLRSPTREGEGTGGMRGTRRGGGGGEVAGEGEGDAATGGLIHLEAVEEVGLSLSLSLMHTHTHTRVYFRGGGQRGLLPPL